MHQIDIVSKTSDAYVRFNIVELPLIYSLVSKGLNEWSPGPQAMNGLIK